MDVIDAEAELHTLYDPAKSALNVEKTLVLDGQQRLQTLYSLYSGALRGEEGKDLEAYVDVTSRNIDANTSQIHNVLFHPVGIAQPLPLFKIRDLTGKYNQKNSEDISDEINVQLDAVLNDNGDDKKTRERTVRINIAQMLSILREEVHFWIEELDGIANSYPYKTALEIFIRVNSGGTKLDGSDLMFAAMKELSPEIEKNLEKIADLLSTKNLSFEIDTILKGILLVNGKGASVDPEKFMGAGGVALVKSIDDEWTLKYEPAFEALRDFVVNDLKVDSEKVLRSYNSLIPIFEYLFANPTPTPANRSRLKAFFYRAQIFNWFRSQTDGILDVLHNKFITNLAGKDFPIQDICNYFLNDRGYKVTFDPNDLVDHKLRFFLLHILYVEQHNVGAFNVKMKGNAPHIDHIYPKSKLAKAPFSFGPDDINHIGNYRFVGATDNIRKRAEDPAPYFTRLAASGVALVRHLLEPNYSANPAMMTMDKATYLDFRTKRTQAIYNVVEPIINYV